MKHGKKDSNKDEKEKKEIVRLQFDRTKQTLKDFAPLIYSIILFTTIFVIFYAYRTIYFEGLLPGSTPYYYLKSAEDIIKNRWLLSSSEKQFSGYYYLLALAKSESDRAVFWLPALLSVLSLIAIFFLMKEFGARSETIGIALLILASSPAFLYQAMSLSANLASLCLTLWGAYFYRKKSAPAKVVSAISFLAAALMTKEGLIISAVLVIALGNEEKIKNAFLGLIALASLVYILPAFKFGWNILFIFKQKLSLSQIVLELGGISGIGIIEAVVAFIGIIYSVSSKGENRNVVYGVLFLIVLLTLGFDIVAYAAVTAAILAAYAIQKLKEREWTLPMLKGASLLLIMCGLVFATLTFTNIIIKMGPSPLLISSLREFAKSSYNGGIVLSSPENGFYLEYVNIKTFVDETYSSKNKVNLANEIFYSRSLKYSRELLQNNSIAYILITPDMKNGSVWSREDQGLLFILRNKETFRRVELNQSEGIEVWEYLLNSSNLS
ncbi:MAG: hypothetical protein QXW00_01365 [Candidatus Woesearchaeota archaeon]